MSTEKISVIYILSNGRSGSTLLDILLGSHPEIWTLGEAQILPWELRENRAPCGCGVKVNACEFWRSVLPEIHLDVDKYPIEYFRKSHSGDKVIWWEHLLDLMQHEVSGRWKTGVIEYGQVNSQYYEAVRKNAAVVNGRPIRWLVDASKSVYRLFWLQKSGLFDLRVIHLVKDPRAFTYSMLKNCENKSYQSSLRFAGRWLVENLIFSHLCLDSSLAGQTRRLRYEDLATKTETTLASLGQWLGITFPDDVKANFRRYKNHGISGSLTRWQNSEIYLDEKWQRALPQSHRRAVWLLTMPLAYCLGYRWSGLGDQ